MTTATSATDAPGAAVPGVNVDLTDGVLRVTIDRPARLNATRPETLEAIADAFESYADHPDVRVAVITGAGAAFCTGADLSGRKLDDGPADPRMIDAINRAVPAIRAFPTVVIAAVNGPAAGVGVSLALICDITIATESSYFLLAFTKVGLMPDGGASALVAASIGRARALKMALRAERLPAPDALEQGLIAEVYPDETFAESVEVLARQIAAGPAESYRRTKNAINDATLTELDDALVRERAGQLELLVSPDFKEGVDAFLAKRPAKFGGQ